MKKWLEISGGSIILIGIVYLLGFNLWNLGNAATTFFKGGIMWMLLLIGIVLTLIGINDLKE